MSLSAQTTEQDASPPRWSVSPYVGAARGSLDGRFLGITPDRNHLLVGLHSTVTLASFPRWSVAYAPEIVPFVLLSNNPKYRQIPLRGRQITIEDGRGVVAGVSVLPIGIEGQRRLGSRWRAYVAGAGGLVWFTRPVPGINGRSLNFAFEVGGGILWRFASRDSLRVGYKFHHLSNAYTAPDNRGIDGAVFLLGFERAIGARD